MKIYLSGPMANKPDLNYPLFREVAKQLRDKNHIVYNPAENFGGIQNLPRSEFMRMDLSHELLCNTVAVLPGWRNSVGARAEVLLARLLDIPVITPDFDKVSDTIKTIPEGL